MPIVLSPKSKNIYRIEGEELLIFINFNTVKINFHDIKSMAIQRNWWFPFYYRENITIYKKSGEEALLQNLKKGESQKLQKFTKETNSEIEILSSPLYIRLTIGGFIPFSDIDLNVPKWVIITAIGIPTIILLYLTYKLLY